MQDVVFLLNTSHAMLGEPIEQLNRTMQEILPVIENESAKKELQLSVKVIRFSSSAEWILGIQTTEMSFLFWILFPQAVVVKRILTVLSSS